MLSRPLNHYPANLLRVSTSKCFTIACSIFSGTNLTSNSPAMISAAASNLASSPCRSSSC
uniref:Uncharacterized protein n=1 Tax=uncultured marine virus TaxID=186617 RepID=A0A0F7L2Q8_9VIRU|nr:hypothetical protein [uncultured marine virus]